VLAIKVVVEIKLLFLTSGGKVAIVDRSI